MSGRVSRNSQFLWLWCLAFILLSEGCHLQKTYLAEDKVPVSGVKKLVVMGFQSAKFEGEEPDVVRDPLSGSLFMAEPVPHEVAERMTEILFDRLVTDKGYELISPGQAKGVFASIVYSDLNVGMGPIRILQEVGRAFAADAVLAGYIYRWREREGTDYAVNRPASVAFSLHFVRPADGAILWRAKFDKTQRSLSENLLDVATFVKGRGRWMSVERLARIGLEKILAEMPTEPKESEALEEGLKFDSHSSD